MENILLSIYGIGKVECARIMQLIDSNITSEKAIRNRMRKSDIYNTLKTDTRADLDYNPLRKIPRKLIKIVDNAFARTKWHYDIAGSYRRGKSFSGDIDIVLADINSFDTIRENVKLDFIEPFANGEHYIRTLVCVSGFYIKVDIFLTNKIEYSACLLYCTGSQQLNIVMRSKAKSHGWRLDQHGLFDGETRFELKSERDYFDKLGMRYLEPHERNL